MTAVTFDAGQITPASRPAGAFTAATAVAGRSVRKFVRTPQLLFISTITGAMFLLIFRYVFGGAIQTGSVKYADWLIPALLAGSGLFASGTAGVAEDVESGLYDRLRSLPIPRAATLIGRSIADTTLVGWGALTTLVLGLATGFRFHGGIKS